MKKIVICQEFERGEKMLKLLEKLQKKSWIDRKTDGLKEFLEAKLFYNNMHLFVRLSTSNGSLSNL